MSDCTFGGSGSRGEWFPKDDSYGHAGARPPKREAIDGLQVCGLGKTGKCAHEVCDLEDASPENLARLTLKLKSELDRRANLKPEGKRNEG